MITDFKNGKKIANSCFPSSLD